jgi:23S rRNA (adenine2503-C2)-methyltransferase
MNIKKKSFFNFTYNQFQELLKQQNFNESATTLLFNHYYKKKSIKQCTENISKETLSFLNENFEFDLPKIDYVHQSKDKTVKFLFELKDGFKIESVLIPFHQKYSICLSSQVGCAMNCSFCFTGTQGLKRNLETTEIIGQFLQAYQWLKKNRPGEERILNIVFMGQGEPLHNFDSVKSACEIFVSQHGASIALQKITISTSGYIPGLLRWKEEMPGVNLALSFHSPFEEKRSELIPINKKYPLDEVLNCIEKIPLAKKQFITYEYLLIEGFNDSLEDAQKTAELLKGKRVYINLIAFNPFPGSKYKRPGPEKVNNFKSVLDKYKIPTLVRGTKGDDVLAACGQLNTSANLNNPISKG